MTELALLRHGETEWAGAGRIQGRSDVPLGEQGRGALRALALPRRCRGMRVVTSPLSRCVETAALLGAPEAAREPRLAEMSWGEWEGSRLDALRASLGETMRANEARGLDFRPPGGESPREVLARVRSWLAEVAAARQPTLAITHRGVMRVVLAAACAWDMTAKPPVRFDWSALQFFRLDERGEPAPLAFNVPLDAAPAHAASK
jgi:probable phosphoglycerate mutase